MEAREEEREGRGGLTSEIFISSFLGRRASTIISNEKRKLK